MEEFWWRRELDVRKGDPVDVGQGVPDGVSVGVLYSELPGVPADNQRSAIRVLHPSNCASHAAPQGWQSSFDREPALVDAIICVLLMSSIYVVSEMAPYQ